VGFSKANLRELDRAAELAIIGHSVGAFVSTLDASHLKHLATNVVRDVTASLVKLFRLVSCLPPCDVLLFHTRLFMARTKELAEKLQEKMIKKSDKICCCTLKLVRCRNIAG